MAGARATCVPSLREAAALLLRAIPAAVQKLTVDVAGMRACRCRRLVRPPLPLRPWRMPEADAAAATSVPSRLFAAAPATGGTRTFTPEPPDSATAARYSHEARAMYCLPDLSTSEEMGWTIGNRDEAPIIRVCALPALDEQGRNPQARAGRPNVARPC